MAVLSEHAVADELAIRQLTAAYSDAVNRRAADDFAALWTDDGQWIVPGLAETVGGKAAAAQLLSLVDDLELMIQQLLGGQVWVDGDRAKARWTIAETGRTKAGQGVHFIGIYQDEHVRTDAGWKFARRHFEFMYRGLAELPGKVYPYPTLD